MGKLVMVVGERTVAASERERLRGFYCTTENDARAWNEALCVALDAARCSDDECTYLHHGNCSGFLAGEGLFLTAAHCVDGLANDDAARAASHLLISDDDHAPPRRLPFEIAARGKREFSELCPSTTWSVGPLVRGGVRRLPAKEVSHSSVRRMALRG